MTREGPSIEVEASPGIVAVRLPEAPSTGHTWQLTIAPPGVQEVGSAYAEPRGLPVAGGTGERTFLFEVAEPGRYELEFHLQRPWESEPAERRLVTLLVEPAPT